MREEGKEADKGHVKKQVGAVGKMGPGPPGDLWESVARALDLQGASGGGTGVLVLIPIYVAEGCSRSSGPSKFLWLETQRHRC